MRTLIVALGCAFSLSAHADTTVIFNTDNQTSAMKIADGKIMMEVAGGREDARMLFDANQDGFIVINDSDKSYMKFDEQTLEKLTGLQNQMMQQMEAQLAQVPAAQREQMKQMMKNMAGPMFSEPAERSTKYTGSDAVAGYDCRIKEIYADGDLKARQCVVGLGELDIPGEDQKTLIGMQTYLMDLLAKMPMVAESMMEFGDPAAEEMPIRFETFGMVSSSGELVEVLDSVEGELRIPDGYREEQIPMPEF